MKKITTTILIIVAYINCIQAQKAVIPDSVKNYKLEEIIIKSPKYSQNIFEIPAATTILPERFIANNKVENLTDVSAFIPNFFMPDYGSKLTSPVYIRGVGNRINTPSVGLYVDDIPYFEKSAFNFDFYDVERIEVLRGPQGTLYGRNTMGGLINVITNSPEKERETKLAVDYGNYNQLRTTLSHNQPFGKKIAVLTSLHQTHNDGFYTNMHNNSKVDKLNSYSGRMKLKYDVSKKFGASATIQYEKSKQGGYPYALYTDSTNTVADINYNDESIYNRSLLSTGLNLHYSAKNFNVRAVSSYQSINDLQEIDQDFTPKSLFFVTQDQKLNLLSQEINIQSIKNKNYDWLFGVFGFKQLLDKEVTVNYGPDGIKQYKLPFSEYYYTKWYDNSNAGIALFHESTLKFGAFGITAGIRADYEKATLDYVYDKFSNGVQKNAETAQSEQEYFELLPKIALKYSITNYFVPYATVAKGYNSGGFNATFERDEDRTFKPEHSWNYEAGVKAQWLQQRVYANLAVFYIDWTNQQIYQTVPSGTGSMLTNAGKSESKGIELEIKARPAKNTEIWLATGYNEARFVEYSKDAKTDYSGNYLPYVPRFSFTSGANQLIEIDKPWLDHIRLQLTYNGFGKHFWNEDNVAYQHYYGLLNCRASFERKNISISFWGKNILNSDYNSFYFNALGKSYAQVGKPATMGVLIKITL